MNGGNKDMGRLGKTKKDNKRGRLDKWGGKINREALLNREGVQISSQK